jgi:cyclic pyranopterin phosphate synthase
VTPRLTHVDASGQARMVDVSDKPVTTREARARGSVRMSEEALAAIVAGNLPKGDVITTARLAGIMAAKRTSELIPMCHPLLLTQVDVDCVPNQELPGVEIRSLIRCDGKTGAEMEALTAVAVAALTIIDMAKSADRWMSIEGVTLLEKRGGKSGTQRRPKAR